MNVTVSDAAGQSAALANGFLYYPTMAVTSISPTNGPNAGGTSLTIFGTFADTGTYTVNIDPAGTSVPCTGPISTGTQITCTTTAHAAGGPYVIRIIDAVGATFNTAGADRFTYNP